MSYAHTNFGCVNAIKTEQKDVCVCWKIQTIPLQSLSREWVAAQLVVDLSKTFVQLKEVVWLSPVPQIPVQPVAAVVLKTVAIVETQCKVFAVPCNAWAIPMAVVIVVAE